jgi:putative nucleotidyltransferase with HDIG domain
MARQRPTLRLLTRAAEPVPATGPPSRPWLVALVAAGTVLMCTVLLLPGRGAPPPLAPGQTPLADVVAPEDLVVLDEDATEAARAEARAGVPLVFDVRPGEIDRLETKIHDAFALIRQLRFAPRPQTGDAAGAAGAEAGGDPVDELLRTRLGILPPSDLKGVPPERFTRHLEGELVEALRLTLERGVLLDRDDVPGGTEGEILVRTVGEPRETYVKVADVADLATARASMAQMALQAYPDDPEARALLTFLASSLVYANLKEDPQETRLRREVAAAQVKPLYFKVRKGEVIVAAGTQVLKAQAGAIRAFREVAEAGYAQRALGLVLLCGLIFYVFFLDLRGIGSRVLKESPRALLTGLVLAGTLGLSRLTLFLLGAFTARFEVVDGITLAYGLPLASGAMLISLLLGVRTALVFAMMASILMGLMVPEVPLYTLYGFVASLVAIFAVAGCERRSRLVRAGLGVGVVSAVVVAGIDLHQGVLWGAERLYDLPFAFSGGILSAVIVSAVLPVMESVFNVSTNIRLLELSDLNHPLLRRLLERAPGTYHHSMIMSNMAEQAAKAIGENALLARVGCYYHDIGKMLKPGYFIENQWAGDRNVHDRLTPSMSRLVLVSHVRDGIDLGRRHGLPDDIIDMIPQHHGTRVINYFYAKAKESQGPEAPEPPEDSFRYPGPKPQTKVAGIIMLADTVEASSRVLEDPSPARIGTLVEKVVNTIYLDQQLDECELTLKDLRKIADSFTKTLTGTFHHRIQYPGMAIPRPGADARPPDQPSTALSR